MKNKIWIVIPAYNEEKKIGEVVRKLKKTGFNVIVVDDGSKDKTGKIARKNGARVYTHIINRGLGGALNTGISATIMNNADVIITCDADGQHSIEDIKKIAEEIEKGNADVVIGSRLVDSNGMPLSRKIGNLGLNVITWILFGAYFSDTQSGLRAFSRAAAEKIKIKTNRMEVSSEIINEIKRNKLKLKEVPIKAIYTDYSLKKGQKNINGIRIVYKLLIKRLMK